MRRVLAAALVAGVLTGCGVTAQDEPELVPTPPVPTSTPSATLQPTGTPSSMPTR